MFGSISAGNIFNFVPDISSAKSAGSDIIKLLDAVPRIDADSMEGKHIPEDEVRGEISFENVHFRYPTRPGVRVLRGLSIKVEPGTYIALVGGSGSGKSTVYVKICSQKPRITVDFHHRRIQLLERFYDPQYGQIRVSHVVLSTLYWCLPGCHW